MNARDNAELLRRGLSQRQEAEARRSLDNRLKALGMPTRQSLGVRTALEPDGTIPHKTSLLLLWLAEKAKNAGVV